MKRLRKAVIDIGSNSVRLLVANCSKDKITPICKRLQTTRLGSSSEDRILDSLAIKKTVRAVFDFKQESKRYKCKKIYVVATSAVREARNKDYFKNKIKENTGLEVMVLSGKDEANLSYLGAKKGLDVKGNTLVIDIGGGSTELSIGNEEIVWAKSFPIGAVRLTQSYLKSDPPKSKELRETDKLFNEVFSEFLSNKDIFKTKKVSAIGVGGTITSLAAMIQELPTYDSSKIHNYVIRYFQIEEVLKKLLSLKKEDIKKLPGLSPERADIIVAGVFIIFNIMKTLDLEQTVVSESDLMEGFLYKNMV